MAPEIRGEDIYGFEDLSQVNPDDLFVLEDEEVPEIGDWINPSGEGLALHDHCMCADIARGRGDEMTPGYDYCGIRVRIADLVPDEDNVTVAASGNLVPDDFIVFEEGEDTGFDDDSAAVKWIRANQRQRHRVAKESGVFDEPERHGATRRVNGVRRGLHKRLRRMDPVRRERLCARREREGLIRTSCED